MHHIDVWFICFVACLLFIFKNWWDDCDDWSERFILSFISVVITAIFGVAYLIGRFS